MQLSDGGWGWFSGWGEHSGPHTTAVVVHGLQLAQANDVALVPGVLDRGLEWLAQYQAEQVALLQEGERREKLSDEQRREHKKRYKTQASDIDALVFSVLVESDRFDKEMQRFLYRDRLKVSLYSQALIGLALDEIGADEQRDMIVRNLDQFLKVDDENQSAYLDLPNNGYWWYWYGNTIEANAAYLRLLTRVDPKSEKAAGLVKYLLNNRKHGTYWNSTRDTAYCIESLAEYLVASGENKPNMTVEVWVDGEKRHEAEITPETLFSFDGTFVLSGEEISTGPHKIELRKTSRNDESGPLYYNAYLTNFTTEDFITKAGLEIKVERQFYKLVQREGATDVVQGSRGQVIDQAALKYDRVPLDNLAEVLERRSDRDRTDDRIEERLRVRRLRGSEGGRLRTGDAPKRLHERWTGGVRRVPRRAGGVLPEATGTRHSQRELPPAGRDPRSVLRPADEGVRHVRPGTAGELGRDETADCRPGEVTAQSQRMQPKLVQAGCLHHNHPMHNAGHNSFARVRKLSTVRTAVSEESFFLERMPGMCLLASS